MDNNIIEHKFGITRSERNQQNKHNSFVIWFTGLSGSGKSTLANKLEQKLFENGYKVYVLDGDNVRLGINKDLDFTAQGRKENIRRVAEIAKLMMDAGLIVITSFISPFRADRKSAREIIGTDNFTEIFVDCPFEVCEQRDVKGLYAKAKAGEIKHFTGIKSNYELPENPDITVHTDKNNEAECMEIIYHVIEQKIKI